jgi:hypothetical protein
MPALSLEEFAVVLAHISHYPPSATERVLAKLGVSMSSFLNAASTHPAVIASAMASEDGDPAARFQARLDQAAQSLAEAKPRIEDLAPLQPNAPCAAPPVDPAMDVTLDPLTGAAPASTPFRPGPAMAVGPSAPRQPFESGDTVALESQPAQAVPFERGNFSHWAVETHASFMAERRFLDADVVRERYGLRDGADEYDLMIHFNRRFAHEPGLRERWVELVQRRAREINRGG